MVFLSVKCTLIVGIVNHLQDGGLLTNNPCAIALHEARLLWGKSVPIQCVISLGTGLYLPQHTEDKDREGSLNSTSLREKLTKIAASATDTEGCENLLLLLLSAQT